MATVLQGIVIGIIATIVLDAWAAFVKHVLQLPTANWALVGRWVGHLPRGVFFHDPVSDSRPVRGEPAIGWITHYAVGVAYGVTYLFLVTVVLERMPTLASAVVFGLVTLAAPWLVMQPAMGAGVFASRTPRPGVTRLVNLSMHVVFGTGLYVAWRFT